MVHVISDENHVLFWVRLNTWVEALKSCSRRNASWMGLCCLAFLCQNSGRGHLTRISINCLGILVCIFGTYIVQYSHWPSAGTERYLNISEDNGDFLFALVCFTDFSLHTTCIEFFLEEAFSMVVRPDDTHAFYIVEINKWEICERKIKVWKPHSLS